MGDGTEHDWPWLPPADGGAGSGVGPEPFSETLVRRLLEQRVVVLHGPARRRVGHPRRRRS